MDPTLWLMLVVLPVLLLASAFFSGSETALFSLSRHQRLMLERRGGAMALALRTLMGETRGLLITLLLGNMTVNVLFFAVSSAAILILNQDDGVGAWVVSLLSILPLIVMILIGEVLPKLLASRMRVSWTQYASIPLLAVHRAVTPVRLVAQHGVITPLARLIAPRTRVDGLSTGEIESLLRLSQNEGILDSEEERLLQQVLELGQLRVEDLMIPRVDVMGFDLDDDSPGQLMELIRASGLRHIPVMRDSLDNAVGLLYSRQVLVAQPKSQEAVRKLIRQVHFVPAVATADRALVEMRRSGTTFAIVVDEYGGTAGLITLEDIVEHMVGDIAGEYESSGRPEVQMIGLGRWRVDSDLAVHDWPDLFGRSLRLGDDMERFEASTLGGLVMDQLGRVPVVGDEVVTGNVRLRVERMRRHRVVKLVVELVGDRDLGDGI